MRNVTSSPKRTKGIVLDAVQAQESAYRATKPSRDASLDDTLKACLALAATKPKILATYPDAKLLHDGMDKLRGHLTWPEFLQGLENRRILVARAAVLVAHASRTQSRPHRPTI